MLRTSTVASENVDGEAVGEVSKEELGTAVGSVPATVVDVICIVGLGDIVGVQTVYGTAKHTWSSPHPLFGRRNKTLNINDDEK